MEPIVKRVCMGMLALVVLAAAWRTAAADAKVMEVYPLFATEPTAAIGAVEAVLGEGGKVIYDRAGVRLLVLASPDEQARVRALLQQINTPPVNVRVELVMDESERRQLSEIGVSGRGGVHVDADGRVTGGGTVTPRAQRRSARQTRGLRQSLLLQSGSEGVLNIGEDVPYREWLVHYGWTQGYIQQVVELREVGAVLRVKARVIGEGPLISLKLTPEITGVTGSGAQSIAFTRLSTDVTVEDGQPISLGGLQENTEFYEKFLVGVDREGNRRSLTLTVTPRIERPGGGGGAKPGGAPRSGD